MKCRKPNAQVKKKKVTQPNMLSFPLPRKDAKGDIDIARKENKDLQVQKCSLPMKQMRLGSSKRCNRIAIHELKRCQTIAENVASSCEQRLYLVEGSELLFTRGKGCQSICCKGEIIDSANNPYLQELKLILPSHVLIKCTKTQKTYTFFIPSRTAHMSWRAWWPTAN